MKWVVLGHCWPSKRLPSASHSLDQSDSLNEGTRNVENVKDDVDESQNEPPEPTAPEPHDKIRDNTVSNVKPLTSSPGSNSQGAASADATETPTQADFHSKEDIEDHHHQRYPYFVVSDSGLEAAMDPCSLESLSRNKAPYGVSDAGTYAIAGILSGQNAIIQNRTVLSLNLVGIRYIDN